MDTGLRWQELRRLTWGDVDWNFGDFGSIEVGKSKAKNFRVVPLTERVHSHLKEKYEQAQENSKVVPLMRKLPVLPSPLDPSIPFFDVRRPLSDAGYKIGIGPHSSAPTSTHMGDTVARQRGSAGSHHGTWRLEQFCDGPAVREKPADLPYLTVNQYLIARADPRDQHKIISLTESGYLRVMWL